MASAREPGPTLQATVRVPDGDRAERVMAEAWASGALGIEERADAGGGELVIYLPAEVWGPPDAVPVWLAALAGEGVRCTAVETVEEADWSERWKAGLGPIEISERIVVRPSFAEHALRAGQREIVLDPGRAFGTGGHASTRLALEWIDALARLAGEAGRAGRVLDVGTGSGVLAMAALALGAERAVGFDLDADAVREAAHWARENGLAGRIDLFAGGIEALQRTRFDCVVANLLRSEVLPIADPIAGAVAPGGLLVLSGLLEADGPLVIAAFAERGLHVAAERDALDPNGDRWIAPLLVRRR